MLQERRVALMRAAHHILTLTKQLQTTNKTRLSGELEVVSSLLVVAVRGHVRQIPQ